MKTKSIIMSVIALLSLILLGSCQRSETSSELTDETKSVSIENILNSGFDAVIASQDMIPTTRGDGSFYSEYNISFRRDNCETRSESGEVFNFKSVVEIDPQGYVHLNTIFEDAGISIYQYINDLGEEEDFDIQYIYIPPHGYGTV